MCLVADKGRILASYGDDGSSYARRFAQLVWPWAVTEPVVDIPGDEAVSILRNLHGVRITEQVGDRVRTRLGFVPEEVGVVLPSSVGPESDVAEVGRMSCVGSSCMSKWAAQVDDLKARRDDVVRNGEGRDPRERSLSYDEMLPVMVEAMKAMQSDIDDLRGLRAEVGRLRTEVAELRSELSGLRSAPVHQR